MCTSSGRIRWDYCHGQEREMVLFASRAAAERAYGYAHMVPKVCKVTLIVSDVVIGGA
jgi:hypothetical protein